MASRVYPRVSERNFITPQWLETRLTDNKVTIPNGVQIDPLTITPNPINPIIALRTKKFVSSGCIIWLPKNASVWKVWNAENKPPLDDLTAGIIQFSIILHDILDASDDYTMIDALQPFAGNQVWGNLFPGWKALPTELTLNPVVVPHPMGITYDDNIKPFIHPRQFNFLNYGRL